MFAIHSPFLLPSFFRREEKREKMTDGVVKSHAFLLDRNLLVLDTPQFAHKFITLY
jgi:hypothetical protein